MCAKHGGSVTQCSGFQPRYLIAHSTRIRPVYRALDSGRYFLKVLNQPCLICRSSDEAVSEDAAIEQSVVDPDPQSSGCPGSRSGSILGTWIRIDGNWPNKPSSPSFKKIFVPSYVCYLTYYIQVYFSCKNSTFCDLKSVQDPDPHWFVSLGMDPHWDEKLDPPWNQCGSTTMDEPKTPVMFAQAVKTINHSARNI